MPKLWPADRNIINSFQNDLLSLTSCAPSRLILNASYSLSLSLSLSLYSLISVHSCDYEMILDMDDAAILYIFIPHWSRDTRFNRPKILASFRNCSFHISNLIHLIFDKEIKYLSIINWIYLQYYIDNLLSLPYNTICKVFDVLSSYTFYVKMSSSRISMDIQKSGSFSCFAVLQEKMIFEGQC